MVRSPSSLRHPQRELGRWLPQAAAPGGKRSRQAARTDDLRRRQNASALTFFTPCSWQALSISVLRDRLIDAEQQHRFAARIAAAEVEGADVDPGLAQQRADAADEARRVLVDDVEHVAGEIGLDPDAEDLDQPRCAVAEQRARDRAIALRSVADRDAHQRVIVALALVPDFAHVDARAPWPGTAR